ncbi:MAG: acetate kinase [Lentisphaeria bacterium]|nr:acetate kinase [Lentisphaeria bacterium]
MNILVVNAGSSSLKFMVFAMRDGVQKMLAKGNIERIGLLDPNFIYERAGEEKMEETVAVRDHADAMAAVCAKLVDRSVGVLGSLREIEAIGHRVVHGGEKFTAPVRIDEEVKANIRTCADLAPLHNPPNLLGIEACEKAFPGVPNVAVFDTAFHQTMPPESYLYAIPRYLYTNYGIRKYGFHGTSHKYVYGAACEYLGMDPAKARLITCHLGNGCSIAAVDGGRVVETTMGMTPLAGLVMGTRSGCVDVGVILYLIRNLGMTAEQVDRILNKESGLLGLSAGRSSDMRDIIAAKDSGDTNARQAFDCFIHRVVGFVGSYYTFLGGAEGIVFTGGIGENSAPVRAALLARLAPLGCFLQEGANDVMGRRAVISTPESTLRAVVMPTNEELMIAIETRTVLSS